MLNVDRGAVKWVRDPLLPPASRTALPPVRGRSGPRVATRPRARAASLAGHERKRTSRLNATESTLRRNTEFWGANAAPPPGTRVTFGTSPVIFEYYAGSGLQSLVGLDDYRDISGDARGTTLLRNGHYHAKLLVPRSDTGSWSLYSLGGPESNRNYHVLLRDILGNLCRRIGTAVYCDTADRFTQYLAARDAAG